MKTIDLDELHLLDEAEVMGCPFHGVVEDATLTHPAGTLDHPQPTGGAVDVLQVPGWPDVGRTAEQLAADALLGHEWRNYALLSGSGAGRYVCGEALPANAWIYFADTGRTDRVPRPGFRLAPSLTATYDADGGELMGTIVIKRFGLLVAGSSTTTQTVNISLSGIGQPAWNSGAEGNLTMALESQSRSGAKAMFGLWKDGVLVGLIEFAVTGTELGSLSVTPTVFKTRAEVLQISYSGQRTRGQAQYRIASSHVDFMCEAYECFWNQHGPTSCTESTFWLDTYADSFTWTDAYTRNYEFIAGVHYGGGESPVVMSVQVSMAVEYAPCDGYTASYTGGTVVGSGGVLCDGETPIPYDWQWSASGYYSDDSEIRFLVDGVVVAVAGYLFYGSGASGGTTTTSYSSGSNSITITDWTGATYTRTPNAGTAYGSETFTNAAGLASANATHDGLEAANNVATNPQLAATYWSQACGVISPCILDILEAAILSDSEFACFATRRLTPSVHALTQTIDSGGAVPVVVTPNGANTLATALTGVTTNYYTTLRGTWQPETDELEMRDGSASVSFV